MMYRSEDGLEDELIGLILDKFAVDTSVPIGLFDQERSFFSALSRGCFSGFCDRIYSDPDLGKFCEDNHRHRAMNTTEKTVQQCHVGLWNMAYPIYVGREFVATLMCGQRRIINREEQEERTLKAFFERHNIKGLKRDEMEQSFKSVDRIDYSEFEGTIYDYLAKISQLIYQSRKDRVLRIREEKEKSRKINSLVHEILLPMQAITSNIENIMVELQTGEYGLTKHELIDAARFIHTQINILGMHSENVQKSIMNQRDTPYVFKKHSMYRIIKECVDLFSIAAKRKDVELREAELKNLLRFPSIEMSFPHLLHAFKNIYHNAIKYSYKGMIGRNRWISTVIESIGQDRIVTHISNYGVGVEPHELESVFEEGVRGSLSSDRNKTGSGLGLTEVKRIIEKHNGTVTLYSESKGGPYKTTITVVLPYLQKSKGVLR